MKNLVHDATRDRFPLEDHAWPRPHVIDQSDIDMLRRALSGDNWSHGNICREFEAEFAKYVGARHALLVPNGTSAIYLSLLAAGIKPGQEVIIPGITWPSVVYAVLKSGGIPRTVDISPDNVCMDVNTILPALSKNTFAIIPTHLFGSQCDMQEISNLAAAHNIHVIEDAAQAVGSSQGGKKCGTWGLASAFSLNDRKALSCGEGGCITTNDTKLYKEVSRLQLILPESPSRPHSLPGTYKVSEFQAAVALAQLGKLDAKLCLMESNTSYLDEMFCADASIRPQQRPAAVDRQSYCAYCFSVDSIADMTRFRKVLSTKLNFKVSPPYVPLCDVSDFRPVARALDAQTAANLSVRHPNCLAAYHGSSRFPHYPLQASRNEMQMICETIARVAAIFRNGKTT
jgi:dTDP-4-amino-4,6-dideoxygalactose transaminase